MVAREGRKDLTIQRDTFFLQCIYKAAVGCPILTTRGIDLNLPETTERTLLCAAVAEGVDAGLQHRRASELDRLLAAMGVALDRSEEVFSLFEMEDTTLYSRHIQGRGARDEDREREYTHTSNLESRTFL